jgi:hypothetical protein
VAFAFGAMIRASTAVQHLGLGDPIGA